MTMVFLGHWAIELRYVLIYSIAKHSGKAPQVFLLQFAVLLNQQSGKDTHMRQLKIFSTKE